MPIPRFGLQQGLSLLTLGTILLPIVVIGIVLLTYHKKTTIADINRENIRMATYIRDDINTFLEAPLRTANTLAQFSLDAGTSSHLDSLLNQMAESSNFYESIMMLDKSGFVRALGAGRDIRLNRQDYLGIDMSQADHVVKARQLRHHVWSDTFISPVTGEPSLSLTLPYDTGMLVGNISLNSLSRMVTHVHDEASERVFLVNSKGRIIAHPDRNRMLRQENVSDLAVVKAGLAGHEGAYEYREHGVDLVSAVARIPETGWLVIVEQNRNEVLAQQHNMELILVLVLICSLLVFVQFVLYFNARVVRPVIAISSATKQVADGSFMDLPQEGLHFRELHELTDNFNAMAATIALRENELQESNLELEHEIDERLRIEEALQDRNEELASIEEELRTQLDETLSAQEALLGSEERLLQYFERMPVACIILDCELRVQRWNPAASTVFGRRAEQSIGTGIGELFAGDGDKSVMRALLMETMAGTETGSMTLESLTSDGRVILCEWTNTAIRDRQGKVSGVISMVQDISERRLLEQQVLQQQKLEGIGLMAGGIAHDFNNLLTPIFGYAELIRAKFTPGEQVHTRASAILDAANKARDLISQLLTFSRRQLLSAQNCDLNEIVTSFTTIMRSTLRESIELHWLSCATSCPVKVDRIQVEQILLNLAVNAQDAISGNGRITIETGHLVLDDEYSRQHPGSRPGRYVMLAFSDSGCGMDDDTMAHIFEPFFTTKHAGHGTGLGLSTVYGIVKQHQGYIDAQSKPGYGTTFRIYLPECAGEAEEQSTRLHASEICPLVAGRILLVEDNPMVMEIARDLLTSRGHTVLPAGTPHEALELVERDPGTLDLLVSDVVMPQMSGPELYERLAGLQPGLKVLYMSGYTNNLVVHGGSLVEEADFIAKPFTAEKFLGVVSEMLARDACEAV